MRLSFAKHVRTASGFRNGIGYVCNGKLFVALTNETSPNCGVSLLKTRGPGFVMPSDTGYAVLEEEPDSKDLANCIDRVVQKYVEEHSAGSMGETAFPVVFESYRVQN